MPRELVKSDRLQDQIVESIYSPNLTDVSKDIAEIALDSLLDDGILKDLPVVGAIVSVFKGAMDIRDRLFVAKIARFLFRLSEVPIKQRRLFEEKINANQKLKRRVGVTLALLLDRLDDMEKPDFLAWCFGDYLNETITFDVFRRMASAIDIAFVEDLKAICAEGSNETAGEADRLSHMSRTGFVEFRASGTEGRWGEMGSIKYSLSPLGLQFVRIVRAAAK
jgi:hypothetical protein